MCVCDSTSIVALLNYITLQQKLGHVQLFDDDAVLLLLEPSVGRRLNEQRSCVFSLGAKVSLNVAEFK